MAANSKTQRVNVAEIVEAIRRDLRGLPAQTTPEVRAVRRRFQKATAAESPATIVAVADALLTDPSWPERVVACELLVARPDAVGMVTEAAVERWSKELADWGSVDLFGVTLAGVAWREHRVSDDRVMRWAQSTNRWRRRLALVATVPLNSRARGGAGDTARTLKVCRALVDDRDDMVLKALSWALRELSKRDPKSVSRFVSKGETRLAARVRREVKAKLETGRKRPMK
ncbi:MAG: DNA alkylation repair protein [Acidobacteriota bacterium]